MSSPPISQLTPAQLYNLPAMAPPPGVIPNFDNPPSLQGEMIVLNAVLIPLMGVFVVIRCMAKGVMTKNWGWDDYSSIIAALSSVAHGAVIAEQMKIGYGHHLWDIRAVTLMDPDVARVMLANNIPYITCLLFAKLAILLLYFRVFSVSNRMRVVIYILIAFTTAYTISIYGVAIASFVKCATVASTTSDFCVAVSGSIGIFQSVVNVITDFCVLLVPLPTVIGLQMRWRKKLAVSLVFATGLVACAASIGRLVSFVQTFNKSDVMWDQAHNEIYTVIEMNFAIIAGCLLSLPAFLLKLKSWFETKYSTLRSKMSSTSRLHSSDGLEKAEGHSSEQEFKAEAVSPHRKPKDPTVVSLTGFLDSAISTHTISYDGERNQGDSVRRSSLHEAV